MMKGFNFFPLMGMYPLLGRLSLSFSFLMILFLPSCENNSPPVGPPISIDDNPNLTYLDWANVALANWEIGLVTDQKGRHRNTESGRVLNPPNWITADSFERGCTSHGIPPDSVHIQFQGPDGEICRRFQEAENVFGVVIVRYYQRSVVANMEPYLSERLGQILDTTIIMNESLLSDQSILNPSIPVSRVTHYLGRALGLQGWGNDNYNRSGLEPNRGVDEEYERHIMYEGFTLLASGGDLTVRFGNVHEKEKTALKAVYNAGAEFCGPNNENLCRKPSELDNYGACSQQYSETRPIISYADYEDYAPCYYDNVVEGEGENRAVTPEQRLYHPYFPSFVISSAIGNAYSTNSDFPERGEPIDPQNTRTILYIFNRDGNVEKISY